MYLCRIIFFTFLLSSASSQITYLQVNTDDVNALGSWPIDRMWIAKAIQKAKHLGFEKVYLDIQYKELNTNRSESDRYFAYQINHFKSVYLTQEATASLQNKYFQPLAEMVSIRKNKLFLLRDSILNQAGLKNSYIDFPNKKIPSISLIEFLTNDSISAKKILFIGTNIEGLSSFIVNPLNDTRFSSSDIHVWIFMQLSAGLQKKALPLGLFIFAFIISFLNLFISYSRQNFILSNTLDLIVLSLFFFLNDQIYLLLILLSIKASFFIYMLNKKFADINTKNSELLNLADENKVLKDEIGFFQSVEVQPDINETYGILYSDGSPLVAILSKLSKIAESDISIILEGETGTGKELFANFIHQKSKRSSKPFVIINCASIPENLIESELFGHEKGAFTSAEKQKIGLLETADGGTVFLDEIAECSMALQAKLLRVLQEKTLFRVGGLEAISIDVRIISASHKSLKTEQELNNFRSDLFYRLNGSTILIPALRDRAEDIDTLLNSFVRKNNLKYSAALNSWLKEQNWKGNVRELLSTLERAKINAEIQNRDILIPADFELGTSIKKEHTALILLPGPYS
jgi:hypothetical protein